MYSVPFWDSEASDNDRNNGSILDNGHGAAYTTGRHASLMATTSSAGVRSNGGASSGSAGSDLGASSGETAQLLTGNNSLAGQKVNYLDSGYSEEDPNDILHGGSNGGPQNQTNVQQQVLVKTSSGSIYIPPIDMPKNMTMDSRLEYRFGQSGGNHSSPSSHSPTKESLKNSERSTLQYTSSDTPFLPVRNNLTTVHTLRNATTGAPAGTMTGHPLHGLGGLVGPGPQGPVSSLSGGSTAGPGTQQRRASTLRNARFDEKARQASFAKKCSWRCVAIFFVVLALILSAALAYITASSYLPESSSYQSAKACAIVVDNESDVVDSSTSSPLKNPSYQQSSMPQPPAASDKQEPRNLPPDGTTFNQISLGDQLEQELPAYGYWNVQFYKDEPGFVNFEVGLPRGSSLGFYARRNALPTHTNYDLMKIVRGKKDQQTLSTPSSQSRNKRASKQLIRKEIAMYMSEGHWFISLYNDFGDTQEVEFLAELSLEMSEGCPRGCSGHGECVLGQCQCDTGYAGEDCSQGACPLLCGGHGDYINGECECHPGWKGKECSLRHDECEVSDCSGRGHCQEGKCQCLPGFTGDFCEQVDCPDPTCSDHGFCVDGTCVCKKGWKGSDCSEMDEEARQCLPDCSGNGYFDLEMQQCVCKDNWVGDDCSSRLCNLDCGDFGRCEDTRCVCSEGWTGDRCQNQACDQRCSLHGQCKNGTCLCVNGWNGVHCTLEGCPNQCTSPRQGECKTSGGGLFGGGGGSSTEWSCQCKSGWEGEDCSVRLEAYCDDGVDNDQDGLTDCEDPECCESSYCKRSQLCTTVDKPIDILLQRQPPAPTASFFQKMRFIIEEGSLQRYAENTAFNESRAAVLRGRVVTETGRGLVGVRVTHSELHTEGYTMTQEDGWFDFMVNGGGAVTLKFGKSPFPPQVRTLFAPWKEVVVMDPVVMSMSGPQQDFVSLSSGMSSNSSCSSHDYESIKPIVMASWKLGSHSASRADVDKSGIIAETRILQEVLPIPHSKVRLVYHSGRARGYESTIELRLTPANIPSSLKTIKLRITIEGVLFEKTFEADPGLMYTYAWNRENVYRQRVYGTTTAVVKVGYTYQDCPHTIWNVQTTKISGQDLTVSDVGGWDINIHHRYNYQEGILYKGDGTNVFLRERPRLISDVMGDGSRRSADCDGPDCLGGKASEQQLLAPVDIATASDGSIFVGDFNLIRKIKSDGTVKTLLKMKSGAGGAGNRYRLAVNPHDDTLYISDPESHQIIKLLDTENPSDIEDNFERVAGNGIRCLPGDLEGCGDGGRAVDARLSYPKGMAISADNKIFFADGTDIRVIDEYGIISTVVGSHLHQGPWKPLACYGTLSLQDVTLRWPTDLAINPLDDTLHFIDDNIVMKLTVDDRIQIVAGRPLHCRRSASDTPEDEFLNFAAQTILVSPVSVAFSPQGDLYLAESDSRRINRVSVVKTDGRIHHFAGKDSKCNCQDKECPCFNDKVLLATDSVFASISGVAVSPSGTFYISDRANRRIRGVETSIPSLTRKQEYEVYSPETQEVYVFNRFGLHTETRSIPSSRMIFKFSYTVTTSNGKLTGIMDSNGNNVKVRRDYSGRVDAIINLQEEYSLKLDRKKMLVRFDRPDKSYTAFTYTRNSELIQSAVSSDKSSYVYEYDANGRLVSLVTPTGDRLGLVSDLDIRGALVNVTLNGDANTVFSLLMQPTMATQLMGRGVGNSVQLKSDKSFISSTSWGHKHTVETSPYLLLKNSKQVGLAESFPVPFRERTDIGRSAVSRFEWQYYQTGSREKVGKKLRVSGDHLLTVELDRRINSQIVTLEPFQARLNLSSTPESVRVSLSPSGLFATVSMERNLIGQPTSWRWGDMEADFKYDSQNRLLQVTTNSISRTVYKYEASGNKPSKITIPTGGTFVFNRNANGELEYIMTPRGHIHGFSTQYSLGINRFSYVSPWNRNPYELHYDYSGRLVGKVWPGQSAKVVYTYDDHTGQVESIVGGKSSIHYQYLLGTSLVKSVQVTEEKLKYGMKTEIRYHLGLMKDHKMTFDKDDKLVLDNIYTKYTYDGSARVAGITTQIGREEQEPVQYKYNSKTGRLEGTKDLRIRHESLRKTVVEDITKSFSYTRDLDAHGRLDTSVMNINGYEQFRMKLEYDSANQVSKKTLSLSRGSAVSEVYTYNKNGQLETARGDGSDAWKYSYDVNGNVVSVQMGETRIGLGHDGGDRIVMYGDLDFAGYDDRGFVVRRGTQQYTYNSMGRMTSAYEAGRFAVRFYYDNLGRVVAKRDHRANVVQFIYSNPLANSTVSYVHYPKAQRTYHLIYDENDHLVAMDTPDNRYYVGTDHIGTPLAVFDSKGKMVKEVTRSPFGRVTRDSNPSMDLPIDFAGGLIDQYTHLIHIGDRVYDPLLGQWMTPSWEKVGQEIRSPFEVFAYRFHNNDPVNHNKKYFHMTGLNDWLELFGMNVNSMIGTVYTNQESNALSSQSFDTTVGLINQREISLANLMETTLSTDNMISSSTRHSGSEFQFPKIADRAASKASPFGQGLLISEIRGRAIVTLVNDFGSHGSGSGDVIQSVLASVLNASEVLDMSYSGKEQFYFLKTDVATFSNDFQQLQRLSGTYNVTSEALQFGGNKGSSTPGQKLCAQIRQRDSRICVLYGVEKRPVSRYLHKRQRRAAVEEAWKTEAALVKAGLQDGWTKAERVELEQRGEVRGYTGVEVHNVHRYPELIGQSSNIKFVKDKEAKSQKEYSSWYGGKRRRG